MQATGSVSVAGPLRVEGSRTQTGTRTRVGDRGWKGANREHDRPASRPIRAPGSCRGVAPLRCTNSRFLSPLTSCSSSWALLSVPVHARSQTAPDTSVMSAGTVIVPYRLGGRLRTRYPGPDTFVPRQLVAHIRFVSGMCRRSPYGRSASCKNRTICLFASPRGGSAQVPASESRGVGF